MENSKQIIEARRPVDLTPEDLTIIKAFVDMEPQERHALSGFLLKVADIAQGLPVPCCDTPIEEQLQYMTDEEKTRLYRSELIKERRTGVTSITRQIMAAAAHGDQ
ncbi:MAG: hypothetical protein LUD50_08190 [Clostridia bacterium]|nr:hypothetical protein [Clostridia bacterium]